MKTFFFTVTAALFFTLSPAAVARDAEYTIEPVQFDNSDGIETFTFVVGAEVPYKIFALSGDRPRVVIDFPNGKYIGDKVQQLPESSRVDRVRFAWHPSLQKSRVVLDLVAGSGVQFSDSLRDGVLSVRLGGEAAAATAATAPAETVAAGEEGAEPAADPDAEPPTAEPPTITARPLKKSAAEDAQHLLKGITFEQIEGGTEKVNFALSGFFPPKITTGEGAIPQVFCSFKGVSSAGGVEDLAPSGSVFVEEIRVAEEGEGVKVTVDLVQNKDFNLHQFFYRDTNTFSLVIGEAAATE